MIICRKRRDAAGPAMKRTILVGNTYFSYKKKINVIEYTAIFNKSYILFTYTIIISLNDPTKTLRIAKMSI